MGFFQDDVDIGVKSGWNRSERLSMLDPRQSFSKLAVSLIVGSAVGVAENSKAEIAVGGVGGLEGSGRSGRLPIASVLDLEAGNSNESFRGGTDNSLLLAARLRSPIHWVRRADSRL